MDEKCKKEKQKKKTYCEWEVLTAEKREERKNKISNRKWQAYGW